MAKYIITSKSNSSFGMIAKATGVKMTAKSGRENSSFCFSMKNNLNQHAGIPGGVLGPSFAGYVPLASQNPYPIIVYSVANYRPHLSHFWAKCNFRDPKLVKFCLCLYLS